MSLKHAVRFRDLPLAARVHEAVTVVLAAAVVARSVAFVEFDRPLLLAAFLLVAWVAAALRVSLPLSGSGSSMSLSYAISFAALLVLGVEATVLVAVTSGFIQCTCRPKPANPPHQTLFSMATLAVTVQGAGFAYAWFDGGASDVIAPQQAGPLLAATLVYYLLNTSLVALAIGLSTRQSPWQLWQDNFL